MGLLIGRDTHGEIQFRMTAAGADPLNPTDSEIVFDGRFAASRIIAVADIALSAGGINTNSYTQFDFPAVGMVPNAKGVVYRPSAGFTYRAPRRPQDAGSGQQIQESYSRRAITENVYISQGTLMGKQGRGWEMHVTQDRLRLWNYMIGGGYRATIFIFV